MRWDDVQIEILREFSSLGAEAVADLIMQRTGVLRSASSVQRKASRLGLSMAKCETCPKCGRVMKRLNPKSGLCPTCEVKRRTERQRRFNEMLDEEIREIERSKEHKDAEREYQAWRQKTSRKSRKYGLPNMRQRGLRDDGDYV